MIQKSRVLSEFEALSPAEQRRVVDFIDTLRSRAEERSAAVATPLRKEPFYGIWEDRDELGDSSAWVRRLREGEWRGR